MKFEGELDLFLRTIEREFGIGPGFEVLEVVEYWVRGVVDISEVRLALHRILITPAE